MKRGIIALAAVICLISLYVFSGFSITDDPRAPRVISTDVNPYEVKGPALDNPSSLLNESFEGVTFPPAGWTKISPDGGTGWERITNGTTPLPGWNGGVASTPPGGGTASAYCSYSTGGASTSNQYLLTPQSTNIQSNDSLMFWLRKPGYTNAYADTIEVRISTTTPTVAGLTILVGTLGFPANTSDTNWTQRKFRIGNLVPAGSNIYVGFRNRTTNNQADGAAFQLDLVNITVGSPPVSLWPVPEVIYYKMNAGTTTTPNYALPGGGLPVGTITGHTLGAGGQFDSALIGSAGANRFVNNTYAPNRGNGSWTISMWLSGLPTQPQLGTDPCYLFGDVNSGTFRCFWAGAGSGATDTAILLRKTGQTELRLVLNSPNVINYVVHFVYDSAASQLRAYKNGVFSNQVTWTNPNLTGAGPFTAGGYNNALPQSLFTGAKMDEFRFYSRALTQAEITGTWNQTLPAVQTGINPINNQIPGEYKLSQNYPNPFNPSTKINYSIPKSGLVSLKVFNSLGQEVVTLVNNVKAAGNYEVDFNATFLASGVYFYRLESADFVQTKRMMYIK